MDCLRRAPTGRNDIIVVDEYGPLELAHQGWRDAVDHLLTSADAVVLLVVRGDLVDQVSHIYDGTSRRTLLAREPESIRKVLELLRARQHGTHRRPTANAGNLSRQTP